MPAWNNILRRRQAPEVNPGVTHQDIVKIADELGYAVAYDPSSGKVVPVPKDIANSGDSISSIANNWDTAYTRLKAGAQSRDHQLRIYEQMDSAGGEGAVVLDTYADEVVNVVDNSERAVQIEISDSRVRELVMECLTQNGVLTSFRADVRSMCKYGDCAYAFSLRGGKLATTLEAARSGSAIETPLRPSDVSLRFLPGNAYELDADEDQVYKLKSSNEVVGGNRVEEREYLPWEFALFAIQDRDSFPYGNSILEKMRVPFEQLLIVEKLLAVTRANRVDRIAVKVPGTGGDVTSAIAKLSMLKNSLKTLIMQGGASRMTRNQDVGLTEWLWVPEAFKVEKLSTSADFGSIDDVNYFRDKLQNASRLPKGFFISTESSGNQRPMSLRQQDIKFARSLIPISEAYCNGLTRTIRLLAFYFGADLKSCKVRVTMKKSPYVSSDLLQSYKDVMGLVETFMSLRSQIDPAYKMTAEDVRRLLDLVDAPAELLFPEGNADGMVGGGNRTTIAESTASEPVFDSLYEACRL